MASNYNFTTQDMMQPVYCLSCRNHIPRLIWDANNGTCPDCIALKQAQAQAKKQVQAQAQIVTQQNHYNRNTQMGRCIQCGSFNINEIKDSSTNNTGIGLVVAGSICIMLFCCNAFIGVAGIILLIIGLFMPKKTVHGSSRVCNNCGCRWKV